MAVRRDKSIVGNRRNVQSMLARTLNKANKLAGSASYAAESAGDCCSSLVDRRTARGCDTGETRGCLTCDLARRLLGLAGRVRCCLGRGRGIAQGQADILRPAQQRAS